MDYTAPDDTSSNYTAPVTSNINIPNVRTPAKLIINQEELIKSITREVIKQINSDNIEENTLKNKIYILCSKKDLDNEINNKQGINEFLKEQSANTEILYLDKIPENISNVTLDTINNRRIILPKLSCSQMADIVSGKASDTVMEEVLKCLLNGIVVEVLEFEYKIYEKTASKELFTLYENYKEKLITFGLKPVETNKKKAIEFKKKLLTERDVIEVVKQNITTIKIGLKTIITPLALDYARMYNVNIVKG
ncbi:MAG: hypothetical protein B6I31_05165 [Desulfobacteraceae bacterium 4572_19]|nr:MAG: hypothetical protein B6I31_05165 [Desulfobacteraceae bacterium 4572_19]